MFRLRQPRAGIMIAFPAGTDCACLFRSHLAFPALQPCSVRCGGIHSLFSVPAFSVVGLRPCHPPLPHSKHNHTVPRQRRIPSQRFATHQHRKKRWRQASAAMPRRWRPLASAARGSCWLNVAGRHA
ncbi:uncharacterized protein P884DRAFT_23984 [Thermothelomyces heterothallicus CBS 202.75]|uniref:uncharacterized protein n=1 Tax=Thermothelomyces heterothallicus CBS 202.75 TaxID=1149848 RepID=UPI003742E2A2